MIDVARGSYAVVWDEGDGRRHTGRLDILEGGLHLEGRSRTDRWRSRHISFAEVRSVAIGRSAAERIDGRRCLVLELTGSRPLRILALGGSQMLNELADLFARPHVNGSGG